MKRENPFPSLSPCQTYGRRYVAFRSTCFSRITAFYNRSFLVQRICKKDFGVSLNSFSLTELKYFHFLQKKKKLYT